MFSRASNHPNYWAFVAHRVSGVLLALFLPFHFWALGLALHGEAALDAFLRWTEHPLLKFSEVVLVLLLAVHLTGGVRLLVIEFLPWREAQKTMLSVAGGIAVALALAFLLNLIQ